MFFSVITIYDTIFMFWLFCLSFYLTLSIFRILSYLKITLCIFIIKMFKLCRKFFYIEVLLSHLKLSCIALTHPHVIPIICESEELHLLFHAQHTHFL